MPGKILRVLGVAVLAASVLFAWNVSATFAYPEVAEDCGACHRPGSPFVTGNQEFGIGTPWHQMHENMVEGDCLACHEEFPGGPVPTGRCLDCHPGCSMPDFHKENGTYALVLEGPACFVCHPSIPEEECLVPGRTCGDQRIQWKLGETCDPPGSICSTRRRVTWVCNWNCQCVPQSFCGDGVINWRQGETCEPVPGLDKCARGQFCDPDICQCVPEDGDSI